MNLTVLQQVLFIVLIYICVYGITNRICKCFEHCATVRTYGDLVDKNPEMAEKFKD